MQSRTTNLIDILKHKDDKITMPPGWEYVKENKNAYFLRSEEAHAFEHKLTAKCLQTCWQTHQTSSVVNVQESECQTNCFIKGVQVRALFENLNLR